MLEYTHGGDEGALFGAWDFVASFASKEIIDKLISSYKLGKYLQGVFEKAVKHFNNFDKEALKQAVAVKFQNYLSRHKFNLVCKMQSSVYDAEQDVWLPRNIKCMDAEIALPNVSDLKVDHFVKSLAIGHVCQISNYPGVSRTVTGLVFMILDSHLRLPLLHKQLIWFNGNKYHLFFSFLTTGLQRPVNWQCPLAH